MEDIRKTYLQAQAKVKELDEFYVKFKDTVLSPLDYKVHDVSYYIYKNMEKDYPLAYKNSQSLFDYFCECEFDLFASENSQDLVTHIGRTSKFYLVPEEITDKRYFPESYETKEDFITEIFGKWLEINCFYTDVIYLSNELNIIFDNSYTVEEIINSLNAISSFDIYDFYADCINFYDDLQYFKENQVDIFKEYCEQEETKLKNCNGGVKMTIKKNELEYLRTLNIAEVQKIVSNIDERNKHFIERCKKNNKTYQKRKKGGEKN